MYTHISQDANITYLMSMRLQPADLLLILIIIILIILILLIIIWFRKYTQNHLCSLNIAAHGPIGMKIGALERKLQGKFFICYT